MAVRAGRVRVGVDGRTAAGKTTFADELAQWIAGLRRPVLRATLDDFKRPWRDRHLYDRESGEGYYRNAFDYPTLTRLLLDPAAPGGSGSCALCSIDPLTQVDHSGDVVVAPADAVLVVDGVFALRPEIASAWDVTIWLEVDEALALARGAARDVGWAGSEAEAIHRDRYRSAERAYLAEVDAVGLADLVIDNSDVDRPYVVHPADDWWTTARP